MTLPNLQLETLTNIETKQELCTTSKLETLTNIEKRGYKARAKDSYKPRDKNRANDTYKARDSNKARDKTLTTLELETLTKLRL